MSTKKGWELEDCLNRMEWMADDGVFYTLYKISDPLQVPSVTSEQHVPLVRRIFSKCFILLRKLFRALGHS